MAKQLTLPWTVDVGTAARLDPRATLAAWADQCHDLPTLGRQLTALGWTGATLTPDGRQLTIRGPSGTTITLWTGLERTVVVAQLSLAWLGMLGVMTDA